MTSHTDHFKMGNTGESYAGDHLLIEFWGAKSLDDPSAVQLALESGARDAGATIVHSHYHRFGDGGGISGIAVLAESHISIHTWPERGYAAIDIFMCGDCDPYDCLAEMQRVFCPHTSEFELIRRGQGIRSTPPAVVAKRHRAI